MPKELLVSAEHEALSRTTQSEAWSGGSLTRTPHGDWRANHEPMSIVSLLGPGCFIRQLRM